eukprot:scaffold100629_cov41-Tisochrysis_lutea.AAC.1
MHGVVEVNSAVRTHGYQAKGARVDELSSYEKTRLVRTVCAPCMLAKSPGMYLLDACACMDGA